jgi:xanthine dehydrogenase accessory factor
VLVERLGAAERAIVLGLGHVARHLGPLLAGLGFQVVVCDDGETGATDAQVGWATDTIESFDVAEIERRVGGFGVDDFVLIVTRDHAIDLRLLEHLFVHDELGYLGMIGSRGKVGRFRKRLEARGLLDGELGQARWARLRAPVGLNVGAETPEEIAIAIAAELVCVRRLGAPEPIAWTPVRAEDPIDGRGEAPAGSAAEGQRGSIDGRGEAPAGSAAEGQRGSIDGRGELPAAEDPIDAAARRR